MLFLLPSHDGGYARTNRRIRYNIKAGHHRHEGLKCKTQPSPQPSYPLRTAPTPPKKKLLELLSPFFLFFGWQYTQMKTDKNPLRLRNGERTNPSSFSPKQNSTATTTKREPLHRSCLSLCLAHSLFVPSTKKKRKKKHHKPRVIIASFQKTPPLPLSFLTLRDRPGEAGARRLEEGEEARLVGAVVDEQVVRHAHRAMRPDGEKGDAESGEDDGAGA